MIGLDSNILVRIITADDADQYRRAVAFVDSHRTGPGEAPGLFVPPIVTCELAWVLRKIYGRSRTEVLDSLEGLLASRDVVVGDRDAIQAAVASCRAGSLEFADAYIRETCLRAGCDSIATFEKRLLKAGGFQAV